MIHRAYVLLSEIPSTTEEIAAELDAKMKNVAVMMEDLRRMGAAVLEPYGNCGMRVWRPAKDAEVVTVTRSFWMEQRRIRSAEMPAIHRIPVQLALFS